jgi:hypothetical protein
MTAIPLTLWLFVVDLSSRGAGSKLRICFYDINSTSLCGERRRVFD